MDGRWQEPGFSLLGWEVPDKQGEEATVIYVLMDYRWRLPYALMFSIDTDGFVK